MNKQPDYDKLLEPIADVTTSIESLLDGASGKLMGDQREVLKRTYASAWGLHTLLLDIVTNIGIENIARRNYLPQKFDEYLDPIFKNAQTLLDGMDGPLNEEQTFSVDFIRVTGALLRRYVDNLWLYSRLSNDLVHLKKQSITLNTILDPMLWSVTNKSVDLELLIPEDFPPVHVDRDLMQSAIFQIVENAINNTDEGSIRITADIEDKRVIITVTDTGCGIPELLHQDIFLSFFQVNPEKPGLGLGLPIAQKCLLLHKGHIWIESEPVQTTAHIEFPA